MSVPVITPESGAGTPKMRKGKSPMIGGGANTTPLGGSTKGPKRMKDKKKTRAKKKPADGGANVPTNVNIQIIDVHNQINVNNNIIIAKGDD